LLQKNENRKKTQNVAKKIPKMGLNGLFKQFLKRFKASQGQKGLLYITFSLSKSPLCSPNKNLQPK
jgi:hypothetical protein